MGMRVIPLESYELAVFLGITTTSFGVLSGYDFQVSHDRSMTGLRAVIVSHSRPQTGLHGWIMRRIIIPPTADKLPIEVYEAKEGPDLLDLRRGWPLRDSADFRRVHGNVVLRDDQPKVLDFLPLELAFLWLEK